jgi:hypothetical protein
MKSRVSINLLMLALLTVSFVLLGWKDGAMWFALLYGSTAFWWSGDGQCTAHCEGSHVAGQR